MTFGYSDAGRLTTVSGAATATYQHNALGERVKKVANSTTTYFVYDEAGHLIGEYDGAVALIQETVWMGDTPVVTLRPNGSGIDIYYVHTDHLNTPRRITRPSDNAIVWRWDSDPFGTAAANEDPDGDETEFIYHLRFPGQYLDEETGLHYNYFRDYDPVTGRYVQSDPIGLQGGINTYAYAADNPLYMVDWAGLQGSPGIGDQFNPVGVRGDGQRNYTDYFDKRFPRTVAGARKLLIRRLIEKICATWGSVLVDGLSGGAEDVDVNPDMSKFGDTPQGWYERNVMIGHFEFETDAINVRWDDPNCSSCFRYSTTMYVHENTGNNWLGPFFRERSVRMGEWELRGRACCARK